MRKVGDNLGAVQVGSQAAGGLDHRYAVIVQFLYQIGDEFGTLADVFHIQALVQAHGHGFHGAHLHAAIGKESFVQGHELHHFVRELLVMGGNDAAAAEAQLAGAEVDNVETIGQSMINLLGGHELAAGLARFHEIDVILQQGGIQDAPDTEFVADIGDGQHVLQAHRLSADEVGAGFHAHEGDFLRAQFLDGLAEFLQVEVTLERIVGLGDETLLVHQFHHFAAQAGDVGLGRGEMEVHESVHARFYIGFGQDVFCRTALVGGQHILCTKDFLNGRLHAIEGFGACVGIVGDAHGCYLFVRHTVDAGIGEHIHVNIFVLQQEGIVTGFLDALEALFYGEEGEFLDHAHLVHLQGDLILRLIKFNRHILKI